jgi:hypothetical protein
MPRGIPNKPTENKELANNEEVVVQSVQARPDPSNRSKRPRRSSANSRANGPLSMVGDLDHEKYVYRVATDEGNRIEELKSYGYEIDTDQNLGFSGSNAVKTGSAHSVVVDKRTGKKGVLMRQPREFHEEDKAAKAKLIDKTEESMFRKLRNDDGRYGGVENTNSLAKAVED